MSYTVEHIKEVRGEFGRYRYKIFKDGAEFAIFWHDFRGDCEGFMVLPEERQEDPPFGRSSEFLTGGGPLPLGLSDRAVNYLNSL
jgi:hypothetical protein